MKKTLITLMALAGVAAASEVLTLPGSSDFTWIVGNTCNVSGTIMVPDTSEGAEEGAMKEQTVTHVLTGKAANGPIVAGCVENLAKQITSAGVDSIGWFGGTGQGHDANSEYASDITVGTASFSFMSRPALSGEYVALGLTKEFTASSITLSFTTNNKLGYSMWSYDAATTTATQLVGQTKVNAAGDVTVTYDTALVEPSQLFVVWSSNCEGQYGTGQNATIAVSNIKVEYIPEPATATLSLLALAGLAARRRRK